MIEMAEKFTPDWISPPGDTIANILEEREWTQTDFAERMGYTTKHISQLLNGKASITEETALKLESVLGSTARFWLNREVQYRESLARQEEKKKITTWIPWMEKFPIKDLMKNGMLPIRRYDEVQKPFIVKELLQFFGVASPEGWDSRYVRMQVSFRRTRIEQSDICAITSWIRNGEIISEKIDGPSYDRAKFEKALKTIRTLTNLPASKFESQLRHLCHDAGVVLVLTPAIPKAHVSGIARWLNPHKPLIQMSLYGKTNDRFWFTFFHEAGHILMHDKNNVFLDEFDGKRLESTEEMDADKFSRDFLIPSKYSSQLTALRTKSSICSFADEIGIHPGIVVGRLQYEKIIPFSWMNALKVKFNFKKIG